MVDIILNSQVLESQSFAGRKASKFAAAGCEFSNCNFEGVEFKDMCFGAGNSISKYVNCNFNDSHFSSRAPGLARFENCSFLNVSIGKIFCVDVSIVDCKFSGSIKEGNFVGRHRNIDGSFSDNEIINNDFSGLELGDVGFTEIDLNSQVFPESENFLIVKNVEEFIVNLKKDFETQNDKLAQSVHKVINIISMESEGGNNQIFLDKRSFPSNLSGAIEAIFRVYKDLAQNVDSKKGQT